MKFGTALLIGALLLVAAVSTRTAIIATPYGYIEKDRWTGAVTACSIDNPDTLEGASKEASLKETLSAAGFGEREIADYLSTHPSRVATCATVR